MSFLKAQWRKLIMVNYEVNPDLLINYLPQGTELDVWNGKTFVSLVGFMFLNTCVKGLKIPFHKHFEEVNLRFYVRHRDEWGWKRGVVFIKEVVPRRAITLVANTIYHEQYSTHPMKHFLCESDTEQSVEYHWKHDKEWQGFRVIAEKELVDIEPGSEEEFITKHYWGYTKINDRATYEYEVIHDQWQQYKVNSHHIDVDFGKVYPPEFAHLNQQEPTSVILAEGSEVSVESRQLVINDKPYALSI